MYNAIFPQETGNLAHMAQPEMRSYCRVTSENIRLQLIASGWIEDLRFKELAFISEGMTRTPARRPINKKQMKWTGSCLGRSVTAVCWNVSPKRVHRIRNEIREMSAGFRCSCNLPLLVSWWKENTIQVKSNTENINLLSETANVVH
jgi:hypothetical protein